MDKKNPADDFFWGVATSAYQSEGGYNAPGQPRTNWAKAEECEDVAVSGNTADFWNCYREDFARCRALGLNAFRLGIEWSRVQPIHENGAALIHFHALDHYVEMLAECRNHGLEPVVTLHHFVHPAWLGSDPWLSDETPKLFADYLRVALGYVIEKLKARKQPPLRYFITINEPNMLVLNTYLGRQFPGKGKIGFHSVIAAYNNLLSAHVLAYNVIHDLYADANLARPNVTLNNYCSDLYWSDKALLDLLSVRERGIPKNGVGNYIETKAHEFSHAFKKARIPLHKNIPFYVGSLLKWISDRVGKKWFDAKHFEPLLKAIYASPRPCFLDYIGIDYYDPFAAHAFRLPVIWDHEFKNKSVRTWVLNTITSKWWDWRVLPRGLAFFCRYYSEDFGNRPVLIAENGMALRRRPDNSHSPRKDRITRSQFLRLHVHEVTKILNAGTPLIGYLHWSLFDNYEWGSFTPRFGLFALDYTQGTERLALDHLGDCPSATYAELVREARKKFQRKAESNSSTHTVTILEA